MRWTLVLLPDAEEELADIWLRAEDRQAITIASFRTEQELREDADRKGEDFYGDRVFQFGPLAVVYELVPEDRLARIVQVMRIKG